MGMTSCRAKTERPWMHLHDDWRLGIRCDESERQLASQKWEVAGLVAW